MTRDQFDVWVSTHVAHFPGVKTWLGKFPEAERAAILGVWFKHIAGCELDDCLTATTSLYNQAGRAPHYERHPQAIRAIIRAQDEAAAFEEKPPRYVDGEQIFDCPLCQDNGRVSCWHPKTVAAAADGTLGQPFTIYTSAVACSCSAGDRFVPAMDRYSPDRWALANNDGIGSRVSPIRDECWELIERQREKGSPQPAEKQETIF